MRYTRYWRDWSSDVFSFFSSRRRHTRYWRDWSSDVCSSDLDLVDLVALHVKQAGAFRRIKPFVQTGPEIIATEIALFEIELSEGMCAVDNGFNAAFAGEVADRFHRRDLAGDVDHVRDENQPSA